MGWQDDPVVADSSSSPAWMQGDTPSAAPGNDAPLPIKILGKIPGMQDVTDPAKNPLLALGLKYFGGASGSPALDNNPLTAMLPQGVRRQAGILGGALNRGVAKVGLMIPDAATGVANYLKNPYVPGLDELNPFNKQPENLPSEFVSRALQKYAEPDNMSRPEQLESGLYSILAGAKVPAPFMPAGKPPAGGMKLGDAEKAKELIEKRLLDNNKSFAGASQDVAAANAQGIPLRLAQMSPGVQRQAEILANKPGGAQAAIQRDVGDIRADTGDRVPDAVRTALDAHGDAGAFGEILTAARSNRGRVNYEAVKQDATPVMDPDVWHLLENPYIAQLYQAARNTHMQERSLANTVGETSPELADIYAPKVTVGGKPQPPSPGANLSNQVANPGDAIEWTRTGTAPDVRSLDYLQRAMRQRVDQLYSAVKNGTGNVNAGTLASQLKKAQQMLTERLKTLSPAFKEANETYGNDSDVVEAFQRGTGADKEGNFMKLSQQQARNYVGTLSESGLNALRMGVAHQLLNSYENSGRNVDIAAQVLGGKTRQQLLQNLFGGDQSKYDAFVDMLRKESQISKSNAQIAGGSQTYGRAQAGEDFESNNMAQKAAKVATIVNQSLHQWLGSASQGLVRLLHPSTWNEGVASQTARILSSEDPEAMVEALTKLEKTANTGQGKTARAALAAPKVIAASRQDRDEQRRLQTKYGVEP